MKPTVKPAQQSTAGVITYRTKHNVVGPKQWGESTPPAAPNWVTTPSPPNATESEAYNYDLGQHLNTTEGVVLSLAAGTLPMGLVISGLTITGIPTETGTFAGLQVLASNQSGSDTSDAFSITVDTNNPDCNVATITASNAQGSGDGPIQFCYVDAPSPPVGTILWDGNVHNGSFDQWPFNSDYSQVQFSLVSEYGRPPDYGAPGGPGSATQTQTGNGDLCDIASESGQSGYKVGSARVTGEDKSIYFAVKNSANGTEPQDCDIATDCSNRRSALANTKATLDEALTLPIIPNMAERWISCSVFLDANFPHSVGSGFMTMYGMKGAHAVGDTAYTVDESGNSVQGFLGLTVSSSGSWSLRDTWMSDDMKNGKFFPETSNHDYRYQFSYSKNGCNDSAQNIHYVNGQASRDLLDINASLGEWTDFIWHFRTDTREVAPASNNGFIDIYMRVGSGSWNHVLAIRPINVNYEGFSYPKGIGLAGAYYTSFEVAIYCAKARVWGAPNNAIARFDNVKVGDDDCNFSRMTPDGSSYP